MSESPAPASAPSQPACPTCKTPSACRVHGCCAEPAVAAESLPIVAWRYRRLINIHITGKPRPGEVKIGQWWGSVGSWIPCNDPTQYSDRPGFDKEALTLRAPAQATIDALRADVARLTHEVHEQARLNGMGSEREAALLAKVDALTLERDVAVDKLASMIPAGGLAEEARDAAMYRWLREQTGTLKVDGHFSIYGEFYGCDPACIDEAIKDAMSAPTPPQEAE